MIPLHFELLLLNLTPDILFGKRIVFGSDRQQLLRLIQSSRGEAGRSQLWATKWCGDHSAWRVMVEVLTIDFTLSPIDLIQAGFRPVQKNAVGEGWQRGARWEKRQDRSWLIGRGDGCSQLGPSLPRRMSHFRDWWFPCEGTIAFDLTPLFVGSEPIFSEFDISADPPNTPSARDGLDITRFAGRLLEHHEFARMVQSEPDSDFLFTVVADDGVDLEGEWPGVHFERGGGARGATGDSLAEVDLLISEFASFEPLSCFARPGRLNVRTVVEEVTADHSRLLRVEHLLICYEGKGAVASIPIVLSDSAELIDAMLAHIGCCEEEAADWGFLMQRQPMRATIWLKFNSVSGWRLREALYARAGDRWRWHAPEPAKDFGYVAGSAGSVDIPIDRCWLADSESPPKPADSNCLPKWGDKRGFGLINDGLLVVDASRMRIETGQSAQQAAGLLVERLLASPELATSIWNRHRMRVEISGRLEDWLDPSRALAIEFVGTPGRSGTTHVTVAPRPDVGPSRPDASSRRQS